MNLFFAVLLLALAGGPAAALAPVGIETNWNQKTFSISTTGVTSATFDIGGFGSQGYARIGDTYTENGVDGTTLGNVVDVTTNTTNVVGFNWSALAVGGAGSLQISQTIKTPERRGALGFGVQSSTAIPGFNSSFPGAYTLVVPLISTSSTISLRDSVSISDTFTAQTANPRFIFTNLTAAATLYFSTSYGTARAQ